MQLWVSNTDLSKAFLPESKETFPLKSLLKEGIRHGQWTRGHQREEGGGKGERDADGGLGVN